MRGLGLFTAPRNFSHRAEEAASALGGLDCCQLLGDFPVEGELLELREGKMTEAVVPSHEFSLIVGSGDIGVFRSFSGVMFKILHIKSNILNIKLDKEGGSQNETDRWIDPRW